MQRNIAPLTSALTDTTPGQSSDVYTLLAACNQSIEAALDRGGCSRFREVIDRYLEDVIDLIDSDDSWAMGILTHATFADPESGVTLLERLLTSSDVIENLLFVGCLHPPLEQNFPDFPQYWEPDTELDYQVNIDDEVHDRLLAVVGESIHPDRLRRFDDSYPFDLERATNEDGPSTDA